MRLPIDIDHERITEFCRRNHVHRLSFFGSVLCDDFSPESDVDVLVEFEPRATVGYFAMARTPRELSRYFRDQVLEDARAEYVA